MPNTPVALIHLDAIQRNLDLARQLAPRSKIMAVVKADAYGHGAVAVSRALKGVDALCVARVNEGVLLREAEINLPILVLEGFLDLEELEVTRINRLLPVVHSRYQIEILKASRHSDMRIWVKLDTGMHRLGFTPEEFHQGMTTGTSLAVRGVISHLAMADAPGHVDVQNQVEVFSELTRGLDCELSIANSGAILHYPNSHFDWVRPGIMLYGSSPTATPEPRLSAGMTLTAPVLAVNRVHKGESIGYGGIWTASRETRVAVVGLGYADGYPREMPEGTPVLVNGERRPIVGRISMDMLFVQLEDDDKVAPGDPVIFWGQELPVDEIANAAGTIGYTLLSQLTARVTRRHAG